MFRCSRCFTLAATSMLDWLVSLWSPIFWKSMGECLCLICRGKINTEISQAANCRNVQHLMSTNWWRDQKMRERRGCDQSPTNSAIDVRNIFVLNIRDYFTGLLSSRHCQSIWIFLPILSDAHFEVTRYIYKDANFRISVCNRELRIRPMRDILWSSTPFAF